MDPVRLVFVIAGATLGGKLASLGQTALGIVLGALAALAAVEILHLRRALAALNDELMRVSRAPAEGFEPAFREFDAPTDDADPSAAVPDVPPPPAAHERILAPEFSPDAAEHPFVSALRRYFTDGNTLVRTGIIVLFFGVAFLLRYLAEHSHVPIKLRLAGVAAGALVALAFGWRLRIRRRGYGLALQGGAIGVGYLTVFSALRLYSLLTPTLALALLVALAALCAVLALLQDSLAVVLLAAVCGFLAPFLASTGAGNPVALFSYYLVLNIAILAIARFRSWRILNVAGFAFTFVLSSVWGVLQYRAENFAAVEPFLIAFFLLYVAIAILDARHQDFRLYGYIDATIVFGTPIVAFGLQAGMLQGQPLHLGYSALALAALYFLGAVSLRRVGDESGRPLEDAFTALAVAFLTAAVPLALNARWSAVSWSLEGAALMFVGCQQHRRLARAFAALLLLGAGGAIEVALLSGSGAADGNYFAAVMVGIAAVGAACIAQSYRAKLESYEAAMPEGLFLWGLYWWCSGGVRELGLHLDVANVPAANLAFAAFTAFASSQLAHRCKLVTARLAAFALLPAMYVAAAAFDIVVLNPLQNSGWIAWPLAFASFYAVMRCHENALDRVLGNLMHAAGLWARRRAHWVGGLVAHRPGVRIGRIVAGPRLGPDCRGRHRTDSACDRTRCLAFRRPPQRLCALGQPRPRCVPGPMEPHEQRVHLESVRAPTLLSRGQSLGSRSSRRAADTGPVAPAAVRGGGHGAQHRPARFDHSRRAGIPGIERMLAAHPAPVDGRALRPTVLARIDPGRGRAIDILGNPCARGDADGHTAGRPTMVADRRRASGRGGHQTLRRRPLSHWYRRAHRVLPRRGWAHDGAGLFLAAAPPPRRPPQIRELGKLP